MGAPRFVWTQAQDGLTELARQFALQNVGHLLGIGLAFGGFHHLPHQRIEGFFRPAAIIGRLLCVCRDHLLGDRLERTAVGDLPEPARFDDRVGRSVAAGLTGSPLPFTATGTADAPDEVALFAGDGQTAFVGTAVATQPAVRITDRYDNPVPDILVRWQVTEGGGTLTGDSTLTNASGVARVGSWMVGTLAGPNALEATVEADGVTGNPVQFSATGEVDLDNERVIETLLSWIDEDRKATPLKALQGLVWENGYRAGDFTGHVYDDAVRGLRRWNDAGIPLYVYATQTPKLEGTVITTHGGNVAALYAGARPGRIRKLVNLEGFGMPPTRPEDAPRRYARWLDELRERPGLKPYRDFAELAARLRKANARLSAARADFLARHWGRETEDGSVVLRGDPAHKIVNPVLYRVEEAQACWRQVRAPVLWVEAAESDTATRMKLPAGELAARRASFPNLRYEVLPDAGHMLHHDQPEALARLIEEFLGD